MKLIQGLLAASALAVLMTSPAQALTIKLNDTTNVAGNSAALQGFQAAAHFWENMLTNNATVNINIGFTTTGFSSPNIIGSTSSTRFTGVGVADVYGQLATTGTSQLDAIALVNFPHMSPNGSVSVITQKPLRADGSGVLQNGRTAITANGLETSNNREFDNDNSTNNNQLLINGALLKGLGYSLSDSNYGTTVDAQGHGLDATISFNSAFAFDYDPTNGISAGKIDFIGTAIHEFGHALGFVSGVDIYDANTTSTNKYDLLARASVLDLFRYSDDVFNLAPGAGPALDWSVGNSAVAGNNLYGRPYFSFDGVTKGLSAYGGDAGYFSTGRNNGDGEQASHWMDTPYVALPGNGPGTQCGAPSVPSRGIMDPTFAGCEEGMITSLDLAAFDAMGWNTRLNVLANIGQVYTSADAYRMSVPEPATWGLLTLGFGALGAAMRSRRRREFALA